MYLIIFDEYKNEYKNVENLYNANDAKNVSDNAGKIM